MERWWNLRVEVIVPFDAEDQARRALFVSDLERFALAAHDLFGECREVMTATIEEVGDDQ